MITFLAALLLFLLAFAGLGLGVIVKRRSLRGGCGGSHGSSCCKGSAAKAGEEPGCQGG